MAKSTRVKINFFAQTGQALAGITAIYTKTKMLTEGVGRLGQRLTGFSQTITAGVTLPIVAGLTAATKTAVDFEKELAGASRALDFSEKQAKEFSKSARTIAPSLGLAPAKFLELATSAGRLGVHKEDVLEFAKNTAELGFATDTNTTFLAEKLAAIKAIFKSTNSDLKTFGATVNSLDDKVGGTSRDIIKFTARIGGVGKVAGFSSSEVAALGATFLKLGVNVSAAGTGTNTMLLHLASATTLSEKAQNGFEALGLSAQQVEEMMRTDPKKGLLDFLKIANNFKGDKLGTLNAIFGKQHGYKIVSLSEAYGELGRAFKIVGDESAALAKLQAETDKRLGSNAGKIEIFKAQMLNLAITLGTALLPALNSLLVIVTPLIVKFAEFAENNPKLVTMGIIIGGLVAAIGPLLIAIGSVITAVSAIAPVAAAASAGIGSIATIGAKFTGLLFVIKTVGAGLGAIGGFILKIGGLIGIVKSVGVAVWGTVGIIGGFLAKLGGLFGILKAVGAAIGGVVTAIAVFTGAPVALVVAAIAAISAGAYALITNWDAVARWFGGFGNRMAGVWSDLSRKSNNAMTSMARSSAYHANQTNSFLNTSANNIGNFFNYWWDVFTNKLPQGVMYGLNQTGNFLRWFFTESIPNFIGGIGKWFYNAGKHLMITFANGIRAEVNKALAPIIEFTNRVRAHLPSSDAKMGALSDLTASGKALFSTVARGVDPTDLINAVVHGVNATREALQFNPLPANNTNNYNTSQPVVFNFNPTINANSNTDGREIIDRLRPFARELIDMLTRNNNRITRSVF